jgi:uroporphyrinogen-III decarboxylase
VPVQAWAGFGMDAVIWMMGVEGALFMAMEHPSEFQELREIVHETDVARMKLALATPGVDLVVCRGWYGSTDFWSPKLDDRFYFPYVKDLASLAHQHGKPFGLTMSTGLRILGSRIADAGVDVHYFVDPVGGGLTLQDASRIFGGRVTIVGGISIIHSSEPAETIRNEVMRALETFGNNPRFILQPVDSLYPDTQWSGLETMIAAWKKYR